MSTYKISRRKGLGYVYYSVPEGSSEVKIKSLTTGSAQTMSNINGKFLTPELLASNPAKYQDYLTKRDDGIIKILDIWKVPYTRDNKFISNTVNLQNQPINDIPIDEVQITNENGVEVPIETVVNDPTAQVIITDENVEVKTSKKFMYAGLGVLAIAGYFLFKK